MTPKAKRVLGSQVAIIHLKKDKYLLNASYMQVRSNRRGDLLLVVINKLYTFVKPKRVHKALKVYRSTLN